MSPFERIKKLESLVADLANRVAALEGTDTTAEPATHAKTAGKGNRKKK